MVTSWYNSSKAIDLYVDLTGDRPKSLNAHPFMSFFFFFTFFYLYLFLPFTFMSFMSFNVRMFCYKPWRSLHNKFPGQKNQTGIRNLTTEITTIICLLGFRSGSLKRKLD